MSTKLNSYTLPDSVIQKMKMYTIDSKDKDIETGFNLCADNETHDPNNKHKTLNKHKILHDEKHCSGSECTLDIPKGCEKGEHIGLFHTHVSASSKPSIQDIFNAYYFGINCIGSVDERNIKCYIRKDKIPTKENIESIKSSIIRYENPLLPPASSKLSTLTPEEDIENYKKWTKVRNDLTEHYLHKIEVA